MPIYEFNCPECDNNLELLMSINDKTLPACKVCGATMHKKISFSSFKLNGTCWASDNYGLKKETKKEKSKNV